MHQNLDVELSIVKDLFALQQNNILWDVTRFTGGQGTWENMKVSRKF